MISLNTCTGSFNVLSPKYVPKQTKDINDKVFHMITTKLKLKQ